MPTEDTTVRRRLLDQLIRRRRVTLAIVVVLALAAAAGAPRLGIDNSPRAFFVRDAGPVRQLERLERLFGGGPVVRWSWRGPALWSEAGIAWLERATGEAAALDGVAAAGGPLDLDRWLAVGPGGETAAAAARRLRDDRLSRTAGLVAADGASAAVLVELQPLPREQQQRVLADLERLAMAAPAGLEGSLAGLPVIERATDRSLQSLAHTLFPALAIACVLLLWAAFRNLADTLLPLVTVGLVEAALLGLMGWSGARFNLIDILVVPLVFVLALATAVHLQMRFRALRDGAAGGRALAAPAAAATAVRERGWAVLWTAATTAAAFASFATSALPPLRSLGLWTAAGVGLVVVLVFTFQPAAMAAWGGGRRRTDRGFDRLGARTGARLAAGAVARRRTAIVVWALLAAVAAAGAARLEVDTSLLSYFPRGHPLRSDFDELDSAGVGPVAAHLVLELPDGAPAESFRDPRRLERLAELAAELRGTGPILGAVGAGDLVRAAGRRMVEGGPASERMQWLVLGLLQSHPEAARSLERLITADGRAARLTLFLPLAGYGELLPALERAAAIGRRAFPEARVAWAGEYPLVLAAQRNLLSTLAVSLGLTALVVALLLAALLRSPGGWAAAMTANLWPVVLTAGVMGWAGVPLDSTTVMIAAIVLGLAVDDTLHTLGELRRAPRDGVVEAIRRVAPAQLLTTLVLVLGFAGLGLSDFVPISRFGLLTALALAAALAGDWLLLPALLAPPRSASG